MKKIVILCALVSMFCVSCSNTKTKEVPQTQSGVTIQNASGSIKNKPVQQVFALSGTTFTRTAFDGFKLKGTATPDVEKIEVIWKNNKSIDSYFLKAFKKGSGNFESNLRTRLGNLGIGKNVYVLRAYSGSGVIEEATHNLDFKKDGCDIIYQKKMIMNDSGSAKLEKYRDKIRKFSIYESGSCRSMILTDQLSEFNLLNGTKVLVMDMLDFVGGFGRGTKDLKSEKIQNLNGMESDITAAVTWDCLDSGDSSCSNPPSNPSYLSYEILGHVDTLRFHINTGLTKDNWIKAYNELKSIFPTVEELPPEKLVFNYSKINSVSFDFKSNTMFLQDDKWLEKNIVIKGVKLSDITMEQSSLSFDRYDKKTSSIIWYYSEQHGGTGMSITYSTKLDGTTKEVGSDSWDGPGE